MTVALNRKQARIASIRRSDLLELIKIRHGKLKLPDDQPSLCILIALAAVGMTAAQMLTIAPWAEYEVDDLIDEANVMGPWSSVALGRLVSLLDVEREMGIRETGRLTSMRPVDVPWSVVQARRAYRNKIADRKRKRKRRRANAELNMKAQDLDVRSEALMVLLTDKWVSIAELIRHTAKCKAWQRPNGKPLSRRSHLMALRRVLDALTKAELVELKREVTQNGQMMRFARRGPLWDAFLLPATRLHGTDTSRPNAGSPCATDVSGSADAVPQRSENVSHDVLTYLGGGTPPADPASAPSPASESGQRGPAAGTSDRAVTVDRSWPPSRVQPTFTEQPS
jgi:hypothetical protein